MSNLSPSAIHWALAVVLGVALISGLIRVVRVLQKEEGITPMRHAPEGMRPVRCGACHAMQHVTTHGRIFICFSCHSANRIAMDIGGSDERQLVAATGPLRRFEFRREGENFFQETLRADIDDTEAAALIAAAAPSSRAALVAPTLAPGSAEPIDSSDAAVAAVEEGQVDNNMVVASEVVESNETPALPSERPEPKVLGNPSQDMEIASNASVRSKPSRLSKTSKDVSSDAGLPTCVVCLEDPGNMVLLPCAHGGVCDGCSTRIAQNRASGGAHCPHCRTPIETLVMIHEVSGINVKGVEFRIPIARVP